MIQRCCWLSAVVDLTEEFAEAATVPALVAADVDGGPAAKRGGSKALSTLLYPKEKQRVRYKGHATTEGRWYGALTPRLDIVLGQWRVVETGNE